MKDEGTIYKRGNIWWVQICIDGHRLCQSSKSTKYQDAMKLRKKLIGKKVRGEVGGSPNKVRIGALLDDVLKSDIAESTRYIWKLVVEKNLRPFFGNLRAAQLSTGKMDDYRKQRTKKVSDATVNRELTILRAAFHGGRKRTPPKVLLVPHFPMMRETTIREGFLSDETYAALRDALEPELRPLFVVGYFTGIRKSELLAIRWDWVDFEAGMISIPAAVAKTRDGRNVPIVDGDMRDLLLSAKQERDANWPKSPWVFNRHGERIVDFRTGWAEATKKAGVPELHFHDLRRTAVRNMRRAGVPQVVRMAISGHKTDSMERRYNIVDGDDLAMAAKLMGKKNQ